MSIRERIRMRRRNNIANLVRLFDFDDIDRIYLLFCVLAFVRLIWALVKGLTMELAGKEFIDKFIIHGNDTLLSIPEYIEIALILYIVFVAFMHDLIYEPYPTQLPLILVMMFLLFISIGLVEEIGHNLIFAILACIFVIVLFGPINAVITGVGTGMTQIWIIPGLGAAIVAAILSFILPIIAAGIIVVSFIQYLNI